VENIVIDFFSSGHHRSVAGVTNLAASPEISSEP
jgi:hypothetical protein